MRLFVLLLCLLIPLSGFSQEANDFVPDFQTVSPLRETSDYRKNEMQNFDDFFDEFIYSDYGSTESNNFTGRTEQNPTESNYGYDGS